MKNIDDKNIVDAIKKDSKYQVKTTSADILRQYRSEVAEPVKEKRNNKRFFVFGGIGATLIATASILVTVLLTNNSFSDGQGGTILPNATIKNSSFQEQLIAFSAFTHSNDEGTIKKLNTLKFKNNHEEDDEEEISITKENFEDICRTFNDINYSIVELNKETEFKGYEFNKEVNGKTYKYLNEIYFKGEKEPFAKMYFNDEKLVTEEEGENEYQALYYSSDEYYDLTIEKEIETEEDEQEIEYELKFRSQDSDRSYKIKKENEFEGVESESCYSYTTYSDRHFKNVTYSLTYKSEIEENEEKIEVQLTKDNKEYLFEDIIETDTDVKFVAKLEDPVGETLVEDLEVKGIKDKSTITYTYKEFTFTI